ncbi:MAG: hypothetical protein A2166_02080 [Omnitrophica WOR_2 bacterium RBG_13_41_10]|nr:MAG: hypothetical protein A2166_02080 [Omnitrophica WOR_2 bacterium RBG_13_41_10]
MRQQLRELEIKKSKLFKKRLELEKTLNEKMKAQKLEFLELEGLARFSVFDQTLNGITKNTIKIKKESRDDFKSSEC